MAKTVSLTMGLLFLGALAFVFTPPTQAQQPGRPGKDQKFSIFDSQGTRVGAVVGVIGNDTTIAMELNNILFGLDVGVEGFRPRGGVSFETLDCSSQAFMVPENRPLATATVAFPGKTVYVVDPLDAPQVIVVRSHLDLGGCVQSPGFEQTQVPATKLGDLNTLFTPPFFMR